MKGLDDHEDGLNDAAFDRALGGRKRKARARKPVPVAKQPTLADLERAKAGAK